MNISTLDPVIIVAYLVGITAIGIFAGVNYLFLR